MFGTLASDTICSFSCGQQIVVFQTKICNLPVPFSDLISKIQLVFVLFNSNNIGEREREIRLAKKNRKNQSCLL